MATDLDAKSLAKSLNISLAPCKKENFNLGKPSKKEAL
jgi:hypothetical protein